jgi:hypothetical protein
MNQHFAPVLWTPDDMILTRIGYVVIRFVFSTHEYIIQYRAI